MAEVVLIALMPPPTREAGHLLRPEREIAKFMRLTGRLVIETLLFSG